MVPTSPFYREYRSFHDSIPVCYLDDINLVQSILIWRGEFLGFNIVMAEQTKSDFDFSIERTKKTTTKELQQLKKAQLKDVSSCEITMGRR